MRGFDDMERLVLRCVDGLEPPTGEPSQAEFAALERLLVRGVVAMGGPCRQCGKHPEFTVTAKGREAILADDVARAETISSLN